MLVFLRFEVSSNTHVGVSAVRSVSSNTHVGVSAFRSEFEHIFFPFQFEV